MLFQRYIGIDYSGASHRQKTLRKLGSSIAVCVLPASGEAPDLTKRWSRAELTEWLKKRTGAGQAEDDYWTRPRVQPARTRLSAYIMPDVDGPSLLVSEPLQHYSWTSRVAHYRRCEKAPATVLCSSRPLPLDGATLLQCKKHTGPGAKARMCWTGNSSRYLRASQPAAATLLHRSDISLALRRLGSSGICREPRDRGGLSSILKRRVQSLAGTTHRDEWDAEAVALWLRDRDQNGILYDHFCPVLTLTEKTSATREGWILGVM